MPFCVQELRCARNKTNWPVKHKNVNIYFNKNNNISWKPDSWSTEQMKHYGAESDQRVVSSRFVENNHERTEPLCCRVQVSCKQLFPIQCSKCNDAYSVGRPCQYFLTFWCRSCRFLALVSALDFCGEVHGNVCYFSSQWTATWAVLLVLVKEREADCKYLS
jgi:hypothetical protein